MKQLNLYFDDDQHEALIEAKGKMTWKEFMLYMIQFKREDEQNNGTGQSIGDTSDEFTNDGDGNELHADSGY